MDLLERCPITNLTPDQRAIMALLVAAGILARKYGNRLLRDALEDEMSRWVVSSGLANPDA